MCVSTFPKGYIRANLWRIRRDSNPPPADDEANEPIIIPTRLATALDSLEKVIQGQRSLQILNLRGRPIHSCPWVHLSWPDQTRTSIVRK